MGLFSLLIGLGAVIVLAAVVYFTNPSLLSNLKQLNQTQTTNPPASPTSTESTNIKVTAPTPDQEVSGSVVTISGQARVFESVVSYRVKDSSGKVLAAGSTSAAQPDAGVFGPFTANVTIPTPTTSTGLVEVFQASAKDGTDQDKVTIPIRFR